MGLSCGGKFGQILLISVNILFMLLGLAAIIIGILMVTDIGVLDDEEIIRFLNQVQVTSTFSLGTIAKALAKVIIVIGVIVVVISMTGILGVCCKNRPLLILYAVLVILIFVAQLVTIILWFVMRDTIESKMQSEFETLMGDYDGEAATDDTTESWNVMMVEFKCCGVVRPTNSKNDFDKSKWKKNGNNGSKKIPYSCCNAATKQNYKTGTDTACTDNLSDYRTKGCYEQYKEWIFPYQTAVIVTGCIILLVEILVIIFAFIVCSDIGKQNEIV